MQGGKAVCSKLFNNSKPLRKNQRDLPEKYAEIKNQLFSSRIEVQCGQRVASMAISDRQYGHFLVVGAAGASSCLPSEAALFMSLMSANSTIAMMKKLMTAVMKEPYLMFTPNTVSTRSLKSVFAMRPMSGGIMSSVREETIFGKHCQLYLCKKRKNGCPHRASVTSH